MGLGPSTWSDTYGHRELIPIQEFATSDPSFYKHTQHLFLLLHERGLAYQTESRVNYDPVDKTVLANEQVDSNGNSWRSGAKVEKRMLKQWFFKISEFRQQLLDDLTHLGKDSAWPERVLAMQKNWIGKSTGARIKFSVTFDGQSDSDVEVFTTRPDTLFGVQYIALASTHPIVERLAKNDKKLQDFLGKLPKLPPDSKAGYRLPHVRAINPLAQDESTPDATKASLPIFIAPYVLGDYGDGAVMGVPGHDTRDHAFWKHNCDEPVRMVVSSADYTTKDGPFVGHGQLTSNSGPYAGATTAQAAFTIVRFLQSKGLGSPAETWRLRDWLVSRQRYWGTPIPIIHCKSCGPVPVPADQLPVVLPSVQEHWVKGKTGNPLDHAHDWVNTPCPRCGHAAKRDTDTMDTFVDSSWYFMRFPDAKNDNALFSPHAADASLPVDIYVGGVEHAILHLLYARFISKFLATTPYWPAGSTHQGEPFKKVLAQGMVHGKTYSDPKTGRFLKPDEVDLKIPSRPVISKTGLKPNISFEKMSKSKYNGVDPSICINKYGADATRAHILFQAPVSEVLEWDEEKITGITRWLRRLHAHVVKFHIPWIMSDPLWKYTAKKGLLEAHLAEVDLTITLQDFDAGKLNSKLTDGTSLNRAMLQRTHDMHSRELAHNSALWRTVQKTIINVTESYATTHTLNTIVSELMTLTNTIISTASKAKQDDPLGYTNLPVIDLRIHREAVAALLKMMAPITPVFAEECWQRINHRWEKSTPYKTVSVDYFAGKLPGTHNTPEPTSIFAEPFPEPDGTYALLAPGTQKCAVQVNGKLRAVIDMPVPAKALEGEALRDFLVDRIMKSKEGRQKLARVGGQHDIKNARKCIVVKGGKVVNFVV